MADSARWNISSLRQHLRNTARRFGHGRWRLGEDLIGAAYDIVVERVVTGRAREHGPRSARLAAYANAVLRNLVRSGPPRVALDRLRIETLPEVATQADRHEADPWNSHTIPDDALRALSPAEQAAVTAAREAPTMAAAAAHAGMSKRDLRARMKRAAHKIRRLLADTEDGTGRRAGAQASGSRT